MVFFSGFHQNSIIQEANVGNFFFFFFKVSVEQMKNRIYLFGDDNIIEKAKEETILKFC